MELKDFITQTLKDITDGLQEANKYIISKHPRGGIDSGYKRVKFDIAVTSQDENKTGGGGSISVVSVFSVKGDAESKIATTNYNRIEFDVLIAVGGNG